MGQATGASGSAVRSLPRARPPRVPFGTHLWLVLQLRLTTEGNRLRTLSGAAPAVLGAAALLSVALATGFGAYSLMSHPAVAASPRWSSFLLRMIFFLVSTVFVVWPILSAGVDEHSELSRFAVFPIRPRRLFVASSVSALLEPRALGFYPIVIGAALGYFQHRPFAWVTAAPLLFLYCLFNVAWARAGLMLVLNVLRHRRSAEIMGMGFIAALFLATLLPPVDASWVYDLFTRGTFAFGPEDVVDDQIVAGASEALRRLPTGSLPSALEGLARGSFFPARRAAIGLSLWALAGFALAYFLLLRFYRHTARPSRPEKDVSFGGGTGGGALSALFEREASDFVRNPKTRLLCAVPFFLCILLHLVRARDLVAAVAGEAADAWLLGVLCAYGAIVVGANFAQNAFAYDGAGLAVLYAAPVPLRALFVAKNAVHALGALSVGIGLTVFYRVYIHAIGVTTALWVLFALLGQVPVLLAAGNLLSVVAPRKFHASLRRRDRPPALATLAGLAAAAVAVFPMGALARLLGRSAPGAGLLLALLAVAAVAWTGYAVALPRVCALLESRRESVLRAVIRE